MKKILLSIVALCCTVVTGAQSSTSEIQSAILQNGETTSIFYGANALKDAYTAAENGSIITLTSGTFTNPGEIKKSVSIYGAGFEDNASEGFKRTTINGDLSFLAETDGGNLQSPRLEGVYTGTIKVKEVTNMIISKCQFSWLDVVGTGVENMLVRQSLFAAVNGYNYVINGMAVKNCFLTGRNQKLTAESQIIQVEFDHCLLSFDSSSGTYNHSVALYTNSILNNSYNNTCVENGSKVEKCILYKGSLPADVTSIDNWLGVNLNATLFTDATNVDYNPEWTYTLKDPKYKGTDGTEVGINGGKYPWNKQPELPYVKNMSATVDNTNLNVSYEAGVKTDTPATTSPTD